MNKVTMLFIFFAVLTLNLTLLAPDPAIDKKTFFARQLGLRYFSANDFLADGNACDDYDEIFQKLEAIHKTELAKTWLREVDPDIQTKLHKIIEQVKEFGIKSITQTVPNAGVSDSLTSEAAKEKFLKVHGFPKITSYEQRVVIGGNLTLKYIDGNSVSVRQPSDGIIGVRDTFEISSKENLGWEMIDENVDGIIDSGLSICFSDRCQSEQCARNKPAANIMYQFAIMKIFEGLELDK